MSGAAAVVTAVVPNCNAKRIDLHVGPREQLRMYLTCCMPIGRVKVHRICESYTLLDHHDLGAFQAVMPLIHLSPSSAIATKKRLLIFSAPKVPGYVSTCDKLKGSRSNKHKVNDRADVDAVVNKMHTQSSPAGRQDQPRKACGTFSVSLSR